MNRFELYRFLHPDGRAKEWAYRELGNGDAEIRWGPQRHLRQAQIKPLSLTRQPFSFSRLRGRTLGMISHEDTKVRQKQDCRQAGGCIFQVLPQTGDRPEWHCVKTALARHLRPEKA